MVKQTWLIWVMLAIYTPSIMADWQISKVNRQWRHDLPVISVAFSPDSRWLASGSMDKKIKLWNVTSGRLERTLTGHNSQIRSIAFSPNGKLLASGSDDKTVKLWNVLSGRLQYTLPPHPDKIWSVAFSPDSTWFASGGKDKIAKTWNVKSKRLQHLLAGHKNGITSLAFSPDGAWLASASQDRTVKLWNLKSGQLQYTLTGHWSEVWSVAFSPDSMWLASGSQDKTIKIWKVASGKLQKTLRGHKGGVASVVFSPDNEWLASGSLDGILKIWDLADDQSQHSLTAGKNNWIWSIAFSPNGKWLASGGSGMVVIWALKSFDPLKNLPAERFCQHALSPTLINNPRPLKTIITEYQPRQKACKKQLVYLHKAQQRLTNLQKQAKDIQVNLSKNQDILDKKTKKFQQVHNVELTSKDFSLKKQKQAYDAYHQALQVYRDNQLLLNKRKQQITVAEKQIIQERKKMKPLVKKLDVLHRELASARFQQFKTEMEKEKIIEVRKIVDCGTNRTIRKCQTQAIAACRAEAKKRAVNTLINSLTWKKLFPNSSNSTKTQLKKQIRKDVNASLLQYQLLEQGFGKRYTLFSKIRATVKVQVSTQLQQIFLYPP